MDSIISWYFYLFAAVTLLSGLGVLVSRHPITGAVNLIAGMVALAGIYGLLAGPFLAIIQILVYAGAIMMLVVFVIMVLNSATDRSTPPAGAMLIPGLGLAALVVAAVLPVLMGAGLTPEAGGDQPRNLTVEQAGIILFDLSRGWWLLFLIMSLILLVALAGAVFLAKRRLERDGLAPTTEVEA